jgi:hypothetical protein
MATQNGNIVTPPKAPPSHVQPASSSANNRDDSTGGFVDKNPHPYPRPLGGREPSPQGDSRGVPDSNAPSQPGYDFSGSLDGASQADLKAGYRNRQKITDAGSDGMQGA